MAMDESNYTRFTSEKLPNDNETLIDSLQNLHLDDLGFVEDNQTGAKEDFSTIGAGPSCSAGSFLRDSCSSYGSETVLNSATASGSVPQWEGRGVERECAVNGNGLVGSASPLDLFGLQEGGIRSMPYVGNRIGRDQINAERFGRPVLEDGRGLYDGYNGSNSIRNMQFPDNLSGGGGLPSHYHGHQPSRTPSPEEYSYFQATAEPLPDVVLQNDFRFQRGEHELSDGDILVMATRPDGCEYLQEILARRDPMAMRKILNRVLEVIFVIMIDEFGSHLFQKLLELCNEDQIKEIIAKVTEPEKLLIDVANTRFGNCSVRKLVKMVKRTDQLISHVTLALIPGLKALATNPYGSNVIKFLTQIQGTSHYQLLYKAIIKNCLALAKESKGCLTLNICIDNSLQPFRDILLNRISDNIKSLAEDPYGNFVVQHVLELEIPEITNKMCSELKGSYVRLSMHKIGSHVVERCLKSSGRTHAIWELANSDKLDQLACNQYGNYVIQTALSSGKSQVRNLLEKELREHVPNLRSHPYGRNVFNILSQSSRSR